MENLINPGECRKIVAKRDDKINFPSSKRFATFKAKLLEWFGEHGRSFAWRGQNSSLYIQIVSEVLLQRTRAETVSAFIPDFLQKYPSWISLVSVSEAELSANLRPLGLHHRRAASLQCFAREIISRKYIFPSDRTELESIPAVGQYVANAILLFAHSSSAPLLDSGMARLLRRYFGLSPIKVDIRHDKLLQAVAYEAVNGNTPIFLNWAMLDLSASHCRSSSPTCANCPLHRTCHYAKRNGRQKVL